MSLVLVTAHLLWKGKELLPKVNSALLKCLFVSSLIAGMTYYVVVLS